MLVFKSEGSFLNSMNEGFVQSCCRAHGRIFAPTQGSWCSIEKLHLAEVFTAKQKFVANWILIYLNSTEELKRSWRACWRNRIEYYGSCQLVVGWVNLASVFERAWYNIWRVSEEHRSRFLFGRQKSAFWIRPIWYLEIRGSVPELITESETFIVYGST